MEAVGEAMAMVGSMAREEATVATVVEVAMEEEDSEEEMAAAAADEATAGAEAESRSTYLRKYCNGP